MKFLDDLDLGTRVDSDLEEEGYFCAPRERDYR